jgi:ABC-type branched-subunit amino acid transport system substrate-binding protein
MKAIDKIHQGILVLVCIVSIFFFPVLNPSRVLAANAAFDVNKMGDMSDFDPNNPMPVTGDTIKIAVVHPFSGPASVVGRSFYFHAAFAAHDINKRGGLMVDGKKKMIEVIKADNMMKLDECRKVSERMVLQEKVDVLYGSATSSLTKVINSVGKKYKTIVLNGATSADELMDATNFTRYSFMTNFSCEQTGRAYAYYYGQIRKKEKKFYIICMDYLAGHAYANAFKLGLKEYYPEAQVVGEDYHKMFLTDFAPYLTKIKASGAEVIYTADFPPDGINLFKQARQMGITLPFAQLYLFDPRFLVGMGVENTKGLVEISQSFNENPYFKTPEQIKFDKIWEDLWKNKWKAPYDTQNYKHFGYYTSYLMQFYWLLSVIERAGSTDPEKIIKTWEGDSYQIINGKVLTMRACDHKVIQDLYAVEWVPPDKQKETFNRPPYYWWKEFSWWGPSYKIPADKVLPWMDKNLDRCKGKNGWGK